MMEELRRFGEALLRHWVPLLTGGVVMAGFGALEHWVGASVPWPYYAVVAVIFFLYSSFAAWRDEFQRERERLEESARPKLSLGYARSGQRPEVRTSDPCLRDLAISSTPVSSAYQLRIRALSQLPAPRWCWRT